MDDPSNMVQYHFSFLREDVGDCVEFYFLCYLKEKKSLNINKTDVWW